MKEVGGNEAFIDQAYQETQQGWQRLGWLSEPSRDIP